MATIRKRLAEMNLKERQFLYNLHLTDIDNYEDFVITYNNNEIIYVTGGTYKYE